MLLLIGTDDFQISFQMNAGRNLRVNNLNASINNVICCFFRSGSLDLSYFFKLFYHGFVRSSITDSTAPEKRKNQPKAIDHFRFFKQFIGTKSNIGYFEIKHLLARRVGKISEIAKFFLPKNLPNDIAFVRSKSYNRQIDTPLVPDSEICIRGVNYVLTGLLLRVPERYSRDPDPHIDFSAVFFVGENIYEYLDATNGDIFFNRKDYNKQELLDFCKHAADNHLPPDTDAFAREVMLYTDMFLYRRI